MLSSTARSLGSLAGGWTCLAKQFFLFVFGKCLPNVWRNYLKFLNRKSVYLQQVWQLFSSSGLARKQFRSWEPPAGCKTNGQSAQPINVLPSKWAKPVHYSLLVVVCIEINQSPLLCSSVWPGRRKCQQCQYSYPLPIRGLFSQQCWLNRGSGLVWV